MSFRNYMLLRFQRNWASTLAAGMYFSLSSTFKRKYIAGALRLSILRIDMFGCINGWDLDLQEKRGFYDQIGETIHMGNKNIAVWAIDLDFAGCLLNEIHARSY